MLSEVEARRGSERQESIFVLCGMIDNTPHYLTVTAASPPKTYFPAPNQRFSQNLKHSAVTHPLPSNLLLIFLLIIFLQLLSQFLGPSFWELDRFTRPTAAVCGLAVGLLSQRLLRPLHPAKTSLQSSSSHATSLSELRSLRFTTWSEPCNGSRDSSCM